jgi:hypothetical protein
MSTGEVNVVILVLLFSFGAFLVVYTGRGKK